MKEIVRRDYIYGFQKRPPVPMNIFNDVKIYPNGLLSLSFSSGVMTLPIIPSYTKHYYAGSQRVASKMGTSENIGKFNCGWLIIPFGGGSAPINEKATAKEKLDANTASSLSLLQAQGVEPPPYGQNAGYSENCVSSYSGTQEKEMYWFHANHLGSSSFITGIDGEVNQNIEYFPSGEVFVENHINSYNTPYKFNGKELDSETGYYYYGARYYNPRTSIWLNVDPLAEKFAGRSPYEYTFSNPIRFTDPDGRSPLDWFWNSMTNCLEWYSSSAGMLNKGGNLLFNMGKNPTQALTNMGFVTQGTVFSRTRSASFLDGMFNISGDQSKRFDEKQDVLYTPRIKANPHWNKPTSSKDFSILIPSFSDEYASASFNISSVGGVDSKGISYISGIELSINGTYYSQGGSQFSRNLTYSENKLYVDGGFAGQLNTKGLETAPTIGRSFEGRTNNVYKNVNFLIPFNQMNDPNSSNLRINVTLGSTNVDSAYRYNFNVNLRGNNGLKQ